MKLLKILLLGGILINVPILNFWCLSFLIDVTPRIDFFRRFILGIKVFVVMFLYILIPLILMFIGILDIELYILANKNFLNIYIDVFLIIISLIILKITLLLLPFSLKYLKTYNKIVLFKKEFLEYLKGYFKELIITYFIISILVLLSFFVLIIPIFIKNIIIYLFSLYISGLLSFYSIIIFGKFVEKLNNNLEVGN
ncbi:hypothetical protein ACPB8Q_02175 [Methanocaldococcus indicus]|uniref:hypothetical protein n=1 Tax=Methanocaldococcus indicus TaxID=213231 RepID=UPI003C6CF403